MKELSIEEKSRRYDEAVDRARKINNGEGVVAPPDWTICEVIFPELKESEDDRIKNFISNELMCLRAVEYNSGGKDSDRYKELTSAIAWLENQDKQKPTEKVGPNFKIEKGKWYVGIKTLALGGKLLIIKNNIYYAREDGAVIGENESLFIDKHDGNASEFLKLWTIQDAKDGDVLTYSDSKHTWLCIFKEIKNQRCYDYCSYRNKDEAGFWPRSNWNYDIALSYKPATKEQRDLLFKKMHKAGYEWNAEKKELKKIEQKPVELGENRSKELSLSLQIQAYLNTASDELYAKGKSLYSEKRLEDIHKCMLMWKKLHNAYFYQKPVWSEEDKTKINYLIALLQNCTMNNDSLRVMNEEIENWLKSIRPQSQWNPSDEQLNNILDVLSFDNCTPKRRELLESLYNDLKKLREE